MRKTLFTFLFMWYVLLGFVITAVAQFKGSSSPLTVEDSKTTANINRNAAGDLLWDNFLTQSIIGLPSSEWGGLPVGANQVLLADDFVVPGGEIWQIDEIASTGLHQSGFSDVWGVQFYADAGGAPGAILATETVTVVAGVEDPAGL